MCETVESAYKAAVRRYNGANRVLSLSEIKTRLGERMCVEERDDDENPCFRSRSVTRWERESRRMYFNSGRTWYDTDNYLWTWRCWLREPTREERDAENWLPEREESDNE